MPITNSQYVTAVLEEYFVDKDTGLPLAAGVIRFFRDNDRTTPKDVYIISGSPPAYTFTNIGSTVTLSSFGVPQYLGANIMIYYLPFDSEGNNPDPYYVTVESATAIPQFTRENWPPNVPAGSTPTNSTEIENFIPNGQFLSHTNVPLVDGDQVGQITQGITVIAPGGWTYERPNTSTAIDILKFHRNPAFVFTPPKNPRYSVEIMCQSPNPGDTFKDLRIKFGDVNKFASDLDQFTFAMQGANNQAGTITIQLILIKNFGTGGSATTETVLDTYLMGSGAYNLFHTIFIFGDNSGKTIGLLDDDYIQLALRFPVDSGFDLFFTDFMLIEGAFTSPVFPYTANAQFQYQGIAGNLPIPKGDGSDLYLPIVYTQTGFNYDTSNIGKIYSAMYPVPAVGELNCDGARYETAGYSSDGIPYFRLQKVLFMAGDEAPLFGTGPGYFVAHNVAPDSALRITTNDRGATTNISDGAVPTGFTFATIHQGNNYFTNAYVFNSVIPTVVGINDNFGFVDGAVDVSTGFTILQTRNPQYDPTDGTPSADNFKPMFIVSVNAPPAAGTYFKFDANDNTITLIHYYVWFKVDGVGVDPAVPGHTGIEIDILSTDNSNEVAYQIAETISGFQLSRVTTTSGATVTPGSYFNVFAASGAFYCWYKVGGVGNDPMIAGKIAIEVDISSSDTSMQVQEETTSAINNKYFAVPDLRGYILKGFGADASIDPGPRYSLFRPGNLSAIGTYETDDFLDHFAILDRIDPADTTNPPQSYGVAKGLVSPTPPDKWTTYFVNNFPPYFGAETRPWNVLVNYVIKY